MVHCEVGLVAISIMNKKNEAEIQLLADLANKIRIHSIESTSACNAGHPTSCSSCAEIISVLFFHTMRYKILDPRDPSSDRFILSKGHAAPALYAAWCEAGVVPENDLKTYMQFGSDLEGSPTPRLTFVDVATGSLGQGLAVGCGMAYVGKYLDKAEYRTFCLVGDQETTEGSFWESVQFCVSHKLDSLCLIIDVNDTDHHSVHTDISHLHLKHKLDSFGLHTEVIDGHNITELTYAFRVANTLCGRPTAIIARTVKGKNFYGLEDVKIWNGRPLGKLAELNINHLKSLMKQQHPRPTLIPPAREVSVSHINNVKLSSPPSYKVGSHESTTTAYTTAFLKLAKNNSRIMAFDCGMNGDVKKMKQALSSRFVQCQMSEQNLVGAAVGASCRERSIPFASCQAVLFTRSHDQIRMSAISQTNVKFVGFNCGVSIGVEGPSMMALEDLSMFRSIPDCTIFYPSDAVSTERAVELAANLKGMVYIRLTQHSTTVFYSDSLKFNVGKSHVVNHPSKEDTVLIVTAGIIVQEAVKAAERLKGEFKTRVLDVFTVKPLDVEGIKKNARECGGRILVVEDHYYEGGIGEAVAASIAGERDIIMEHVAVPRIPRSGKSEILLDHYGLSARHIMESVKKLSLK